MSGDLDFKLVAEWIELTRLLGFFCVSVKFKFVELLIFLQWLDLRISPLIADLAFDISCFPVAIFAGKI